MSRFDELDKKVHFRLSDALYQGLRDIIGTSLPIGKDLEPISDRRTLKSRKFLIEEAERYVAQCERIASEGWFLCGNE